MSKDQNTKTLPTYRIYSVVKNGDTKAVWTEIGAAWAHKDDGGFNLSFSALPLPGASVVLRKPKKAEGKSKAKAVTAD